MSSAELTEWMAFAEVEPFGEERADLRSAIVAQVIANVNRRPGTKAYRVEDFMPKFDQRAPTPEQEVALFLMAVGDQLVE